MGPIRSSFESRLVNFVRSATFTKVVCSVESVPEKDFFVWKTFEWVVRRFDNNKKSASVSASASASATASQQVLLFHWAKNEVSRGSSGHWALAKGLSGESAHSPSILPSSTSGPNNELRGNGWKLPFFKTNLDPSNVAQSAKILVLWHFVPSQFFTVVFHLWQILPSCSRFKLHLCLSGWLRFYRKWDLRPMHHHLVTALLRCWIDSAWMQSHGAQVQRSQYRV